MNEVLPLQMVVELARSIPCAPWLLPRLMQLLANRDEADANDIQTLMMKDPGLVASVLRLANSAYFSKTARCESVADAVVRIGFREVYRISAGSIAGRWLNNNEKGYGWEPGDLCKHSLCVAVATEALAQESGKVSEELGYTAGLLHDVGKLALAHACADQFEIIRSHREERGICWRTAEHEVLGYDHTDVGGVLMQGWSYPASLVQVACFYPRPKLAAKEYQSLVTHVHAGKHLAISLGYGVGEEGFSTEIDEDRLNEEGFNEKMFEKVMPKIIAGSEKLIAGTFASLGSSDGG